MAIISKQSFHATALDLPWMLFGRKMKPLSAALTVANIALVLGLITNSPSVHLNVPLEEIVAFLAGAAATTLIYAWGRSDQRMAAYGLLLSSGLWTMRSAFILLTTHDFAAAMLAAALAVGSGAAFLLEWADGWSR